MQTNLAYGQKRGHQIIGYKFILNLRNKKYNLSAFKMHLHALYIYIYFGLSVFATAANSIFQPKKIKFYYTRFVPVKV